MNYKIFLIIFLCIFGLYAFVNTESNVFSYEPGQHGTYSYYSRNNFSLGSENWEVGIINKQLRLSGSYQINNSYVVADTFNYNFEMFNNKAYFSQVNNIGFRTRDINLLREKVEIPFSLNIEFILQNQNTYKPLTVVYVGATDFNSFTRYESMIRIEDERDLAELSQIQNIVYEYNPVIKKLYFTIGSHRKSIDLDDWDTSKVVHPYIEVLNYVSTRDNGLQGSLSLSESNFIKEYVVVENSEGDLVSVKNLEPPAKISFSFWDWIIEQYNKLEDWFVCSLNLF